MTSDQLIKLIQDLAKEYGRPPLYREIENKVVGFAHHLKKNFGTFKKLLKAAGIEKPQLKVAPPFTPQVNINEAKLLRKYQALCAKKEQIQGFFRHTLDLKELFERAGNPPVLKLVAQPDTHDKFKDVPAVNCFIKFIAYFLPDIHMIMGDFVDCEGLSHWPSDDLEPRRIVPEMKTARELLRRIIEATPTTTTRIYLEGNHENWINQAFARMPELFQDLADLDIEINLKSLLALEKFGYQLFPMNHLVQIGKAHFTHGIYTPQHHAAKHLNTFKCNIYYGHMHDMQSTDQTSVDGAMEAHSLGCLCRLDAKFLKGRPNNWVHGFGVFEFFPDGTYNFYKLKIVNGRLAYNGLVFDGNEV